MAFTIVTVSGTYEREPGVPASGSITFQPVAEMANDYVRAPVPKIAYLNAQGTISIALEATDDPGTLPVGNAYIVTENLKDAVNRAPWLLTVPHASSTLDLKTVQPALAANPAYKYLAAQGDTATGLMTFNAGAVIAAGGLTVTAGNVLLGSSTTQVGLVGGNQPQQATPNQPGNFQWRLATNLVFALRTDTGNLDILSDNFTALQPFTIRSSALTLAGGGVTIPTGGLTIAGVGALTMSNGASIYAGGYQVATVNSSGVGLTVNNGLAVPAGGISAVGDLNLTGTPRLLMLGVPTITLANPNRVQVGGAPAQWWGVDVSTASLSTNGEVSVFQTLARTLTATAGWTTQRSNLFQQETITAGSAQTITNAATVAIAGAPIAAGSAVITNPYGLWIANAGSAIPTGAGAFIYADDTQANTSGFRTILSVAWKDNAGNARSNSLYHDGQAWNTLRFSGGLLVDGAFSVRGNVDTSGVTNLDIGTAGVPFGRVFTNKLIGGATSLSIRNNADTADNLLVTDAGKVTARGNLGVGGTADIIRPSTYGIEVWAAGVRIASFDRGQKGIQFTSDGADNLQAGEINQLYVRPGSGGSYGVAASSALQRNTLFDNQTFQAADAGTYTITSAATVAIAGAPIGGTRVTITNPYAFWVQGGTTRLDGPLTLPNATGSGANGLTIGTLQLYDNTFGVLHLAGTGNLAVDGGKLYFGATLGKIIGGATSLSLRNNADTADNLLLDDSGNATIRNNLTVTNGLAVTGSVATVAGLAVSADPGGTSGKIGVSNVTAIGNGANTNLQAPALGTGGGPSSLVAAKWLKVYDGTTTRYIPMYS